ncbi:uncharacterized protein LOC127784924 isoform X2 [Oryza glaberrima]|uniref:uncharacterized protein LOC127784924 isoform X2 n=1 Tax=Oryza glaberrima TaxID=4538 RepID=UPI00224C1843|nr:uncharacterized protein LOC127784924 isoform X2 [Oryza glaberrima]
MSTPFSPSITGLPSSPFPVPSRSPHPVRSFCRTRPSPSTASLPWTAVGAPFRLRPDERCHRALSGFRRQALPAVAPRRRCSIPLFWNIAIARKRVQKMFEEASWTGWKLWTAKS